MKPDIHPQYKEVTVTCSCGSTFITRSTLGRDSISLEVCSKCHPFYTGTQKIMDTAGRVDRFRQKYGMKGQKEAANTPAEATATETPKKAETKPAAKAPEKKVEAKKADTKKADTKKAEGKKATSKKVAKDDKKAE